MNFPTAIKTVLTKYIDFNGRASRSELWYWFLGVVVVSAAGNRGVQRIRMSNYSVKAKGHETSD